VAPSNPKLCGHYIIEWVQHFHTIKSIRGSNEIKMVVESIVQKCKLG
jgi:hypothetical protein